MKNVILILGVVLALVVSATNASAQPVPQENTKGQKDAPKKSMKILKVKISGMTCAHGCAKGIEDKVYQTKGVKSSVVDFESMTGTFIFDSVKITKEQLIAIIEGFSPGEDNEHKYKTEVISYEPNK